MGGRRSRLGQPGRGPCSCSTPGSGGGRPARITRTRVLKAFLATTMDYPWEEIHDEADRLEHAASEAMIERIDTQLDHPSADPHGDPIPTAKGQIRRPIGVARLTEVEAGRYEVIRLSDADPQRLIRFRDCGLTPGKPVQVIAHGPRGTTGLLGDQPRSIVLAPAEARAIWVAPPRPRAMRRTLRNP